jgi:hypothetical protein
MGLKAKGTSKKRMVSLRMNEGILEEVERFAKRHRSTVSSVIEEIVRTGLKTIAVIDLSRLRARGDDSK